jgi:biopolymer transport protein ExbB
MENLRAFLAKAGPIGVAIPAMVAHNYLQGKVHKVVSEIKEESGILLDALEKSGRLSAGPRAASVAELKSTGREAG